MHRSIRPQGQHTRGKTALNRLRQVDVFVALAHADALTGESPLAVDVGFGAHAWTALEMAHRWRHVNPSLRMLGIEIDPARVAAAAPHAHPPAIDFRLGGFNLAPVLGGQFADIVRCYNVLRQYDEAAVDEAMSQIAAGMRPGALLVEGTSNPSGAIVAFDVWRRTRAGATSGEPFEHLALVFGTNFSEAHDPRDFQTILPKRLIHHMLDDRPARFFDEWRSAFALARGRGEQGARRVWIVAADLLRERFGHPVDPRRRLIERGYVVVRDTLR